VPIAVPPEQGVVVEIVPAAGLPAWVYFVDDNEPEFFSVPLSEMIANFDHRRYRDAFGAVAGFSCANRIGLRSRQSLQRPPRHQLKKTDHTPRPIEP